MNIREELSAKVSEYINGIDELKGKVPSMLLIDFVIEKYKQHRNFPSTFNAKKIEDDMTEHLSTMAMAVVDIFMKVGAEGEKNHSENGINRTYENAYISLSVFNDVLPFVRVP